ncbi:hypothetical protein Q9233_007592 [Columba guinea]|nr:hypothetical protein Q9233_007592 [Columba guinea]
MEEFRNLDRDIEGSAKRWKKFVESECPEKEKFPQEWKNKSALQRLCILRAVRPDRMSYAVRDFVEEKLGSKYVVGRSLDFATTFEESGPATPMFFILSPGVDPLKDVEKQAMSVILSLIVLGNEALKSNHEWFNWNCKDVCLHLRQDRVVDFVALHELLKALIIGQQGQQELSVLEPGQSPTLGLGKGKVTKEKPGQEEKERDICKKRALLQDPWEEINKFKEAQCGLAEDMRAMQKARSGMAQDIQEVKDAHSGLAEDIQEIQETLGLPGSSRSQATIPGDAQEPAKPWGSTSTSSYESEMREVLSQVGQLGNVYAGLKEEVEQLKSTKAECADLENVRRLFPKGGRESITSILADLKRQVSFLQDMSRALHGEEEKIRKVEDAPRKTRGSGAGRKAGGSGRMTRQPRPKGQKVKAERKELGKQQEPTQAELKQVADEYVKKLVRETAQQAEQLDKPRATAQRRGHEQAGCHFCRPATRVLLGKLLHHCEKLEEQVESLAQKVGGKVDNYAKWRRQSLQQAKQLKCLRASIVQLQKDCEKLSLALTNLQHDLQQKQNDIKALSQALERIKKQKVDKEELLVLGIDEKADKDKISRRRFEACMEQLNKVMEEVTGQVKFLHRFQQDLRRQMDCKLAEGVTRPQLDCRELAAFRQQQEERWKSLSGQLQEKALQPERDDAAGIRKQLLPGFHCLSCDRPLNMLAPGPERTGECRYPTVTRSCGGPHTVRPPRFQPQPPSTPRPSQPSARSPNKVIVPILTNKKNHQGWPQVVSQDIVRHVHNLKSTVFTVVGQVDGKTLLPLPAGSEGIEDVDLENEKSMERIDKSLVYAMESAIIDWSHQIQEALKKESSEPLLQGSDPNPKVELGFWKNRTHLNFHQLLWCHYAGMGVQTLTEAQDVRLHLMPLKCRLEDIERVEFSEVKPFLLPLLHVVCLIWVTSKHYNMPVRIVVLLQEICNLLIEQALVYLSPEDLLKGDMEESLGKVRMVLGILNTFKEAFEERREKLHTYYEPGQEVREWDFNSTMVFVRLDTFLKRLEMVEDLLATALDLMKLEKIEFSGIKGKTLGQQVLDMYEEFQEAYKLFSERTYDCLDLTNMVGGTSLWEHQEHVHVSKAAVSCCLLPSSFLLSL